MKDLYVLTADTDALAVIKSVMGRPRDLGIRSIEWEVDRHAGRDSGMVKDGPELIRMKIKKAEFQKVLLIWDYHGSGESRLPQQSRDAIRLRLRQVTWEDRSEAVVVVPEIEEWLWHDPAALAQNLEIDIARLQQHIDSFVLERTEDEGTCKMHYPKELFEFCLYQTRRRKPLPEDFRLISASANLIGWQASTTFAALVEILRNWFPGEGSQPTPKP
jgi:hypothetical protein